jgi:hypothetical protein
VIFEIGRAVKDGAGNNSTAGIIPEIVRGSRVFKCGLAPQCG